MDESLSPQQIKHIFRVKTEGDELPVFMYEDIIDMNDIQQMFKTRPYCVIFYPYATVNNVTMGHYCALLKNDADKTFYYYDSLGYHPDHYKQTTPMRFKMYREHQNTLIKLLLDSIDEYSVDYNHHQHQSRKPDIATCGRHCVFRCFFHSLSNDEYNKLIKKLGKRLGFNHKLKDVLIYEVTIN